MGINQVAVLKKSINWSEAIDTNLKDAAKTDGMSGFCMFLVTYSLSVLESIYFCLFAVILLCVV